MNIIYDIIFSVRKSYQYDRIICWEPYAFINSCFARFFSRLALTLTTSIYLISSPLSIAPSSFLSQVSSYDPYEFIYGRYTLSPDLQALYQTYFVGDQKHIFRGVDRLDFSSHQRIFGSRVLLYIHLPICLLVILSTYCSFKLNYLYFIFLRSICSSLFCILRFSSEMPPSYLFPLVISH